MNASPLSDESIIPPVDPPTRATHWSLKKGIAGPNLTWPDHNGIDQIRFAIEDFDRDEIVQRWGYAPNYLVRFSEQDAVAKTFKVLGAHRAFGIQIPAAPEPLETLAGVPGAPAITVAGPLGEALALATALTNLSKEDTARAVQLQAESHHASLAMMTQFMTLMKAPTTDPGVAMAAQIAPVLQGLATQIAAITKRLDDEDGDEEDEDESEEESLKRLAREIKSRGFFPAFSDFVTDRGLEKALLLVPKLEEHLPGIMGTMGAKLATFFQPKPAPAPAAPPLPTVNLPVVREVPAVSVQTRPGNGQG